MNFILLPANVSTICAILQPVRGVWLAADDCYAGAEVTAQCDAQFTYLKFACRQT